MNEVEKNLLKNIQGAIQSGDYFFKCNDSPALAFNIVQLDTFYKELFEEFPKYQYSGLIPSNTASDITRNRNKLAHELLLGDSATKIWNELCTDLYQIDTKLKKILGDDYAIISEIPAKEFEEVDKQIHADIIIQNDQSVAIMHSIADTPKLQQIHDNFLLKEKQFQTEKKKQITERFTDTLQIIIDDYNTIQNQINRRKGNSGNWRAETLPRSSDGED